MTRRQALPQLGDEVFLTDGGMETDLIFNRGLDLPLFASFVLLDDPDTAAVVRDYFGEYLRIAAETGHGLVLETPTWRASSDWGEQLGYDDARLADVNRRGVQNLLDLREQDGGGRVVISGCVGPRGDAYADLGSMTVDEASQYHSVQIGVLADSGVDLVSVLTLTNIDEAVGVVLAAQACDIPAVISFTVETDGVLPTGMAVAAAVRAVDVATDGGPAYYMINCAHPDHFAGELANDDPALERIRGVRANASRLSHAELDECEELDDGDPDELGGQLAGLHAQLPHVNVLGGCCGTDSRHVAAIATALAGR